MMLMDRHLHTDFSDGQNTPTEMVEKAIELGIEKITFTDHVRKYSDWVREYVETINGLNKIYKEYIDISIGVECKVLDFFGNLDCPDAILFDDHIEKVAAIHRIPNFDGGFICRQDISNEKRALEAFFLALQGIGRNKYVSRVAHPFSLFNQFRISKQDDQLWKRMHLLLDNLNMSFEYNVKYDNSMVPKDIWSKHREKVVVGSDSHSVNELEDRLTLIRNYIEER